MQNQVKILQQNYLLHMTICLEINKIVFLSSFWKKEQT